MRRVDWAPGAEKDLDEISDFIGADNPYAARRTTQRIVTTVERLAFMPAARTGRVPGSYEMPVSNAPYIVAFELPDEATLRVLRIIHMSRDWPAGGWPEERS